MNAIQLMSHKSNPLARATICTSLAVFLSTLAVAVTGCGSMEAGALSGISAAPMPTPAETAEPDTRPDGASVYVRTDKDPFSTFAADVDSASYDLFVAAMTSRGELPDPATVRSEEFINSFSYDYPTPSRDAEHPFAIDLAAAPGLYGGSTTLLRVGIQTREREEFRKKATNLAFLVDTSGSMQDPAKLPLVQRLLNETLTLLDPEDQVAVVTYAGSTRVALPSTKVSESDGIRAVIDGLGASGSTAGASGLDLAYEEVGKNFVEGGINHVILCTDGDFNVGPSTTQELVSLIEERRETGITFTAVGFGGSPNDAMLEAISNKGNGIYGVVATPDQVSDYAQNRMLSSLQLVAKDVKIQVEFNPDHVFAYRLIGYENRQLADYEFYQDAVDAGEVGAGHRVTALYELALDQEDVPSSSVLSDGGDADASREVDADDLVVVKVRYKQPDMNADDASVEIRSALGTTAVGDGDDDLRWAAGVASFADMLGHRLTPTSAGLDRVESLLDAQAAADPRRAEFAELVREARPLLTK